MTTPRKRPEALLKRGRKSLYKAEFAELARNFALLGSTDEEMAFEFGVSVVTFNAWKKAHPEFLKALSAGKKRADALVAKSFYQRAVGYSHKAVKIMNIGGTVVRAEYIERFPPDAGAALNWLKNRQPRKWRDKVELEHTGKEPLAALSPLELARQVVFSLRLGMEEAKRNLVIEGGESGAKRSK